MKNPSDITILQIKEIHCIGGLPGSGKTYYGKALADELNAGFIDDIMYIEDIELWHDWEVLVITDPFFCEPAVRNRAEKKMRSMLPNVKIVWHFFENDAKRCRENVALRNDGRMVEGSIKRFHRSYRIPDGVKQLPVWREGV